MCIRARLSVDDVKDILVIPLLGIIPGAQAVLKASNAEVPVTLDAESDAGQAYTDLVGRFLGEERKHRFLQPEKKNIFQRIFSSNKEETGA